MGKSIDVSRTDYALDVPQCITLAEQGYTIRVLNDDGSLHMIMSIPQEPLECCKAAKDLATLKAAAQAASTAMAAMLRGISIHDDGYRDRGPIEGALLKGLKEALRDLIRCLGEKM